MPGQPCRRKERGTRTAMDASVSLTNPGRIANSPPTEKRGWQGEQTYTYHVLTPMSTGLPSNGQHLTTTPRAQAQMNTWQNPSGQGVGGVLCGSSSSLHMGLLAREDSGLRAGPPDSTGSGIHAAVPTRLLRPAQPTGGAAAEPSPETLLQPALKGPASGLTVTAKMGIDAIL